MFVSHMAFHLCVRLMCIGVFVAAKGSSGGKWECTCAANRLPKVSADDHDTGCFTACNCKSGMCGIC